MIIPPAVSGGQAQAKYPTGRKTLKPYRPVVRLPLD